MRGLYQRHFFPYFTLKVVDVELILPLLDGVLYPLPSLIVPKRILKKCESSYVSFCFRKIYIKFTILVIFKYTVK